MFIYGSRFPRKCNEACGWVEIVTSAILWGGGELGKKKSLAQRCALIIRLARQYVTIGQLYDRKNHRARSRVKIGSVERPFSPLGFQWRRGSLFSCGTSLRGEKSRVRLSFLEAFFAILLGQVRTHLLWSSRNPEVLFFVQP